MGIYCSLCIRKSIFSVCHIFLSGEQTDTGTNQRIENRTKAKDQVKLTDKPVFFKTNTKLKCLVVKIHSCLSACFEFRYRDRLLVYPFFMFNQVYCYSAMPSPSLAD